MLTQIKQAIATKVDGIATYGFGGDDATDPLVDQAFAAGHRLHHAQHLAAQGPGNLFPEGPRLYRRQ